MENDNLLSPSVESANLIRAASTYKEYVSLDNFSCTLINRLGIVSLAGREIITEAQNVSPVDPGDPLLPFSLFMPFSYNK